MESINQKVWHLMRADPAITRDLQRKLINSRALAKYLLAHYTLDTSLDSVISSIRRFPMADYEEEKKVLHRVFHDSVVSTSNNMACVTIQQNPSDVLAKINGLSLSGLRFVTGNEKIKIIIKNTLAPKITALFKKCQVEEHLSEISVTVGEEALVTKGVMATIASEISLANINIKELLVCPPQFFIYVDEKDIVKAHERVLSLTE
ncbi:MAG TPA: hypothetical protein VJJ82_04200 [Candidatus Nanoarchaeia archaeon]|nr:hypothetical protein [Candidatus Nanoarchaeia archaeon]